MQYKTALKQMDKQMEFLGIGWERLVHLLRFSPTMFPARTIDAWGVILKHHDNCIENLL